MQVQKLETKFIAACADGFLKQDGLKTPSDGAVVNSIITATGIQPIYAGKPNKSLL